MKNYKSLSTEALKSRIRRVRERGEKIKIAKALLGEDPNPEYDEYILKNDYFGLKNEMNKRKPATIHIDGLPENVSNWFRKECLKRGFSMKEVIVAMIEWLRKDGKLWGKVRKEDTT